MQNQDSTKQTEIKQGKKITKFSLENTALSYLHRFGGTEKTLRDSLTRYIKKSLYHHPHQDIQQINEWLVAVIDSAKKYGYINDIAYAKSKIATLIQTGNSKRLIASKLLPKGIGEDIINDIINTQYENGELQAAIQYAKRKKFGIYSPNYNGKIQQKHLAAMGRRGFAYAVATQALQLNNVH